jgi:uncharacterized membrane protein YhaH (DUF805 family)
MFNHYLTVLKKYAIFEGRASRAEFWYFHLFSFIIYFGLFFIDSLLRTTPYTEGTIFALIYLLVIFVPEVAVAVRRMHDVGQSGWFIFVPIYNLILILTKGTKGDNKYGPDPRESIN